MLFQSCSRKQSENELYKKLRLEFSKSIKTSYAKNFEFQYDGLTPQESYFIGCELKYLTLKKSSELTDINELIVFEKDSIFEIIRRIEIYEGNDNGNTAGRNWNKIETDSIYIINFKNKKTSIYANNKLIKTSKDFPLEKENSFIYNVKEQTNKNYNCK